MGRRRRRWREPTFLWWLAFLVLLGFAWWKGSWPLALIALLAWCLYEFALVPAMCRVMTREGFSCRNPIRGRVFACGWPHQKVKNDALWRLVGLPNPFREKKIESDPQTGVVVFSPAVRGRLGQADRFMLVLAGLGTVVAITATIAGYFRS